jgi:hypothetical protein
MTSCSRVSRSFVHLLIFALAISHAALRAQTEDPPVIDVPAPAETAPVVETEPPATEAEPTAEPPPSASPEPIERPAAPAVTRSLSVPPSAEQPPLPTTAPPPFVTTELVPGPGAPAAVVPSASGSPIVVQPPVIEPPKVIDEPWTIARAIPWLIAGLLIGGSLAVLLVRERKRRRLVRYEVEKLRTMSAEPVARPLAAPPPPHPVPPRDGVQVLVRKVGQVDASEVPRPS